MRCPGSLLLETTAPDRSSLYADEGTAAHLIATECLQSNGKVVPDDYLGRRLDIGENTILVDHDMVLYVEQFLEVVAKYAEGGGQILVDKRVDFSRYVGHPGSTGTADVIILFPDRIIVIDLKYGMGVKVYAANNEQCRLYGLGALHDYGIFCDPKDVVMVIHQPRLEHLDEDTMLVEDLEAWAQNEARPAADEALGYFNLREDGSVSGAPNVADQLRLEPGEKQCRFCRVKASCPALSVEMSVTIGKLATADDFADLAQVPDDDLELKMLKVPLVETYCKAIRAEIERRLFAGHPSKNFKLVEGRLGNRAWSDEGAAEAAMRSGKAKPGDMYEKKLLSPTKAEKAFKKTKPKLWDDLQQHIVRAPGKPSVAPVTDKRPALVASTIEDFRDLIKHDNEDE